MHFGSLIRRLLGNRIAKSDEEGARRDWAPPSAALAKSPGSVTGSRARHAEAVERKISAQADHPRGFGYKISWFAVRTEDAEAVVVALKLGDVQRANWESGIDLAYERSGNTGARYAVFVTPPIAGWVLAVGKGLPVFDQEGEDSECRSDFLTLFMNVAAGFAEVQFFGTYRVVGYDAWFRARNGVIEREFSIADGQVCTNFGPQTAEERALGFLDLGERSAEAATDYICDCMETYGDSDSDDGHKCPLMPSEENTMALAGAWSIDPTTLEELDLPAGVGYLGYLPMPSS